MALTSANPQQPTPTPTASEDPDVGNGVKLPQVNVPAANPLDQGALATLKTPPTVINNQTKSSGSDIFGTIGSTIGKIIPFLFGNGGYVDTNTGVAAKGLASGGPSDNMTYGSGQTIEPPAQGMDQGELNKALATGYMVGALHQRDFDGTPETLEQATQMINKMMGGEPNQGFAPGGYAQPQTMPIQQPTGQMQPQVMPAQQPAPRPMGPATSGMTQPTGVMPTQPQPAPGMPPQPPVMPTHMANHPIARGYMQNHMPMMAAGGPPLQPGQPFMGEGEVKGPGGPTDDAIPAKLSNGEYVMSAPAVAFFGVDKMDKMNQQGKEGFMQSKAQVDANQAPPGMAPPAGAQPPGMPPGMPPNMGAGMMQPPQMPMQQAKGGPAVQRSRGSGYMG